MNPRFRHLPFAAVLVASLPLLGAFGCTEQPAGVCEAGEQMCNKDRSVAYVCKGGLWAIQETCAEDSSRCEMVGTQAQCVCQDGSMSCSEDSRSIRACVGGAWTDTETCAVSDVCNHDGEADAYACMPAQLACDPNRERERCRVVVSAGDPAAKYTADAYTCAPNGLWTLKTTCTEAQVCLMKLASPEATKEDPLLKEVAVCEPFPCQEGVEYCPAGSAAGNPHVCENGVLVKKSTCEPGSACVINRDGAAGCVDWRCATGSEWCNSDGNAYRCNEEERWELKEACSAQQACVHSGGEASCQAMCTPGAQQCSGGAVQTCGSDRFWATTTECLATQECVLFEGVASCRDLP
jgi:hypothetical protein